MATTVATEVKQFIGGEWVDAADGATYEAMAGLRPAFSKDGAWIAYVSGLGSVSDLRVMRPDGLDNHSIFTTPDQGLGFPVWSPNGQWIAFTYALGIAIIHPDGTGFKVLVDSAFNETPAWGPALK